MKFVFSLIVFFCVVTVPARGEVATNADGPIHQSRTLQANVERDFIGWLGEKRQASTSDTGIGKGMEVLSWDPKVFLFKGFLSEEECDELVKNAEPRLERSGVSDSTTGQGLVSDIRTSKGMFYNRGETDLIRRIEDRIARWVMVPKENGEGIQVLRYERDQKYSAHHDYFSFEGADRNGGNRMVTVLMYLSDVEEGGETVFPKVKAPASQAGSQGWSQCAMDGMAVKPRKGDAVAFWSINSDGRFEPKSLHGSCPVIQGVKWSATKWIHVGRYAAGGERAQAVHRVQYVPPPPPDVAGCINKHKMCDHWAESGECEANPGFMTGKPGVPGECLKACGRCDLGPNDPKYLTKS